jgi:hypothetical protein
MMGLHWHLLQWRANMGYHSVHQASKFGQGFGRCHGLAEFNGATRRWIGHPRGQSSNGPVRQVAVDVLTSGQLGCSTEPQILAEQWVPAILNFYGLQTMGIMFRGRAARAKATWPKPSARAILQGYRVMYRETHLLLDELAEAVIGGTRKEFMESVAAVPLLIIDDFGMRKLPLTAAEDLRRLLCAATNEPVRCLLPIAPLRTGESC